MCNHFNAPLQVEGAFPPFAQRGPMVTSTCPSHGTPTAVRGSHSLREAPQLSRVRDPGLAHACHRVGTGGRRPLAPRLDKPVSRVYAVALHLAR